MTSKKVFILSLLVTLAVMLPIFLFIITNGLTANNRTVNNTQQNVAITAGVGDYKNVLLITQNPQPIFVLVRIDAVQNKINGAIFPKDIILLENGAPQTLEKIWLDKGPAQAKQTIEQTFQMKIDNYYQTDVDTFASACTVLGSVRFNLEEFGNIKNLNLLKQFAYNGGVNDIGSKTVQLLLAESEYTQNKKAALRARIYTAFLHSEQGLPQMLLDLIDNNKAFTDLTAVTRADYRQIVDLLKQSQLTINIECIPCISNNTNLELNEKSVEYITQYIM